MAFHIGKGREGAYGSLSFLLVIFVIVTKRLQNGVKHGKFQGYI